QPDGSSGQMQISLRLTQTPEAADAQLAALKNLAPDCANQVGKESVPGDVSDASTEVLPRQLSLPSTTYRTTAHLTFNGKPYTYLVDVTYMTSGRARVVVEFDNCCQQIDDAFQTQVLEQVATAMRAVPVQ